MAVYLGSNKVGVCIGSNGGGGDTPVTDAVQFIDYDGTILHEYSAQDFLALSAMPANPSHTGLVAQGWNWSLADAQAYVRDWEYLVIGQQYITASGDTEIDIELHEGRLDPYLSLGINGTVTISWGDNTTTTVTGTSITTQKFTQHIYSSAGQYTISIHIDSGSCRLLGESNKLILSCVNNTLGYNRVYAAAINAVRIGSTAPGDKAFRYCAGLKTITIPNTIDVLGGNELFHSCVNLKSITIPYTSFDISSSLNSMCINCYNLSSISFSKKVISFNDVLFQNCYNLSILIVPDSVTSISGLWKGGVGNVTYPWQRLVVPCQKIKKIYNNFYNVNDFLEGMTSIPNKKFGGIDDIVSIDIPNTITSIGDYAFCGDLHLKEADLSKTSITQLRGHCFHNDQALNTIKLPSTVTTLGTQLYNGCMSLSSINLNNITTIDTYCFNNCQSLDNITLSNSITSIGNSAFYSCSALREINIPSGITAINGNVFNSCVVLSKLTIPATVTSIGGSAFYNCQGIKEYHFLGTSPATLSNVSAFNNIPSDCTIYVPYSADHSVLNAYKTATNWSTYASKMQEEPQ